MNVMKPPITTTIRSLSYNNLYAKQSSIVGRCITTNINYYHNSATTVHGDGGMSEEVSQLINVS